MNSLPYPKTPLLLFKELVARLLRGYHLGANHDCHMSPFQGDQARGSTLIASTYESSPTLGCVYDVAKESIIPLPLPTAAKPFLQCDIFLEPPAKAALISMHCHCFRCVDCLSATFRNALYSRQSFPPMCCHKSLSIHHYAKHLSPDVVCTFVAVADEYKADNSLYCAIPSCSAFSKETLVENGIGICPKCFEQTCVECQKLKLKHSYEPWRRCPSDEEEMKIRSLAVQQKWKACPNCQALVERSNGCNHMKCHCGQRFCYQCGEAFASEATCKCGLGLGHLQAEGHAEGNDEETDDSGDEDEEDAAERRALQAVGIDLAPGDLARMRAREIRFGEQA